MSQYNFTLSQIEVLCEELQPLVLGSTLKECLGKDISRPLLVFERDNHLLKLLLCFQKPFIRFHPLQIFADSEKKATTHPLNKLLAHGILLSIEVLNQDRILSLGFDVNGKKRFLVGEFFSKHPNCHLLDEEWKILWSLHLFQQNHYLLPPKALPKPDLKASAFTLLEVESLYTELENKYQFDHLYAEVQKSLNNKLKIAKRQQEKIVTEINNCKNWQEIHHSGDLVKANFHLLKRGLKEITVYDWEKEKDVLIPLDPNKQPQDQVSLLYRRSKKMQKGIEPLQAQLRKTEDNIKRAENDLEKLATVKSFHELMLLSEKLTPPAPKKKPKRLPRLPYEEFLAEDGTRIWVGKNAKDNETLTFKLAKGSDWWLHANDVPGSHVVIRTEKNKDPEKETVSDAIQLALQYSKAKNQKEAEVLITQQKFVKRFGSGQTGKVQVSKHKVCLAKIDHDHFRLIKQRKG